MTARENCLPLNSRLGFVIFPGRVWSPFLLSLANSRYHYQVHDASSFGKSLTLESVVLLPRSRLPLSWLDVSLENPDVQAGQLFMANIPDLEDDLSAQREPVVLVARFSHDSGLCVIERVKRGIYAVCRLARWVEEGDLFVAAKGWRRSGASTQEARDEFSGDNSTGEWWEVAKIDDNAVFEFGSSAKGIMLDVSLVFDSRAEDLAGAEGADDSHLSVAQSYDVFQDRKNHSSSDLALLENSFGASQDVPTPPEEQEIGAQPFPSTSFDDAVDNNIQDPMQSPDELLDGLRRQYLEALYASKVRIVLLPSKVTAANVPEDVRCVLCKRSVDTLSYGLSIIKRRFH